MRDDDQPASGPQPNRRKALRGVSSVLAVLIACGLLFAILAVRDDDEADGASTRESSDAPPSSQTNTTVDARAELVARLEEILAKREVAYRKRDPDILREIYTVDCPCLKSDSNAIRELRSEGYNWVGGETSIKVRRLERVTERMWILIADFSSEPLRIETESGRIVRNEPRGSDLFQFVLAKEVRGIG